MAKKKPKVPLSGPKEGRTVALANAARGARKQYAERVQQDTKRPRGEQMKQSTRVAVPKKSRSSGAAISRGRSK
jgi:hypothetical protein